MNFTGVLDRAAPVGARLRRHLIDAQPIGQLARLPRQEATAGIDRLAQDLLGWLAATSSISMPPSVDAITVTRPLTRSSTRPK